MLPSVRAGRPIRSSGATPPTKSHLHVGPSSERRSREALENAGGTHAASDAHGDHTVACVAALQFTNNCGGQFCAPAAERGAEGAGGAVGIYARGVETGLLDDGGRLRGEGFVKFHDRELVQRKSSEV